jgi:hypothetical protein
MSSVWIVFNRNEPLLAFNTSLAAGKYRAERDFLDDEGIFTIKCIELIDNLKGSNSTGLKKDNK